ncbi:DnaB-like helicase N-terminal domain-containing protein [Actinokineospora enzanensis]|uniref:DnaB-like helicase N-terminal domain-containing protein n=1 Tax=Actinokineospora enzanensis TaxID=155975 RepID=UPI0003826401|nr:DnaB-like helicase N-terminal domain-containing protein [Actinokineospora enzanensis]
MSAAHSPTLDPERIVLGTLMWATPDQARPHLSRLDPGDFTDPRGREALAVMSDLIDTRVPSLDPATLLTHAQRGGMFRDTNTAHLLTGWVFDAHATAVPLVVVEFHIAALIETAYRRALTAHATRLRQIADMPSLAEMDHHLAAANATLARHRARIDTPALRAFDERSAA